jgi:DNA-binding NtrC family response regulator
VVDDEAAIRLLCKVNLELEGYEVVEAASLGEARRWLDAGVPDLVLLDMHVGAEAGTTLLHELAERRPPIPVAVVTGSADLNSAGHGIADAVLGKPFTIDELTGVVRSLTAGRRAPL